MNRVDVSLPLGLLETEDAMESARKPDRSISAYPQPIIPIPSRKRLSALPIPDPERIPAQEDGPFWYFRGVPLGLDMVPGISGAGRTRRRSGKQASAGVEAGGRDYSRARRNQKRRGS